jgi:hypothetical protein
LAQAFQQMTVKIASLPTRGTVTFAHDHSSLHIVQVQSNGRTVAVDPSNSSDAIICKAPDDTTAPVSVSGPSFSTDVTFKLVAVLDIGFFTVQQFTLEAVASAGVNMTTGSLSFNASVGPTYTCTIPLPDDITIPSPIFIGPVELDGSITPTAGVDVTATASGTLTIAGPTASDTVTATDGIQYMNGAWGTVDDNSNSGLHVTPAGVHLNAALKAAVDPFFRVDAGFSADLGGIYSLANINLAYVQASGDFSLGLAAPFLNSTLGYDGPQWNAGFELQAGPELVLSGPVFNEIQQFLSWIGVDLTVNVTWGQFDQKIPLASSPTLQVIAPGSAAIGQPLTLSAQVPAGFAGDTVKFEGFKDGATSGTVLNSTTVSGTSATATWTPTSADSGTFEIGALLFDSIFGPFNLPYAWATPVPPAYARVIVGSSTSTSTTATPTTTTTTTPSPPSVAAIESAICSAAFPNGAGGGDHCGVSSVEVSTIDPNWVLAGGVGAYNAQGQLDSDGDAAIFNLQTLQLIGPINVGFCDTPTPVPGYSSVPTNVLAGWGLSPCS